MRLKTLLKNIKASTAVILLQKLMRVKLLFLIQEKKQNIKKDTSHRLYLHDASTTKKIDFDEVVVYDKDEMTSVSSAEKISKINSIKVFYLEGGIQSWTENNLPLVEGK